MYGAQGEITALCSSSASYPNQLTCRQQYAHLMFGGRLVRQFGAPVALDRLGSVKSQLAGSQPAPGYFAYNGVVTYLPFGEDLNANQPFSDETEFGTYWEDSSTGLNYADQRYYASRYGRFISADPYKASAGAEDPGSWNKYSYVEGDPVNRRDPRGLFSCGDDSDYEANVCDEEEPVYYYYYDPGDRSGTTTGGGGTAFPTLRGNASKFVNAFNKGLLNAISRLQKNKDCDSLFKGNGISELLRTNYFVEPLGALTVNNGVTSVVGAATFPTTDGSPATLFINSQGDFLNQTMMIQGKLVTLDLGTNLRRADFDAFILLHELGHVVGIFGSDANNPTLNRSLFPDGLGQLLQMTRSAFSKTAIFSLLCGAAAGLLGFQLEQKNERSVPLKLYVATSQAIYCGSSDVGGVLQLRVQVKYLNVGSRPIILLRDVTSITEVNLKKESGPGDDLKFLVTNATSFPKIPEDQSTLANDSRF